MIKLTVEIEGMVCGICEAHINEAVRNAFPVKKGNKLTYKEADSHYCGERHSGTGIEERDCKNRL